MIVHKISAIHGAKKYVCSTINVRTSIDTFSDKYVYTSIKLQLEQL